MILSDRDIKRYIEEGKIKIKPLPDLTVSLGSCSLDLRLGEVQDRKGDCLLKPGKFCLATTLEFVEIPDNLCGLLHGRSSIGRKGIMVHSTAALIDAGFQGKIVLELFNAGGEPVKLKIGERICAISFEKLSSPAQVPYYKKKTARYSGQKKPKQ